MSSPEAAAGAGRLEYLRYLEENKLSEAGVLPIVPPIDDETQARVAAVLERARKEGHHHLIQRLAEAATSNTNDLLALMNAALLKRFGDAGAELPAPAFAGVFPTDSFNAHVVMRPSTYLILVNTGAVELIEAMTSIISSLDLGTARTQAQGAAEMLRKYCEQRTLPQPTDLKRLMLHGDRLQLSTALTTAVEEFVLAHEYAHLVRGDLGHVLGDASGRPASKRAEGGQAEIEADLWAANAVMCAAESDEERTIRCSGPLIFLSIAGIIEAYFEQVSGRPQHHTHPPAADRFVELRYALAKAGLNSFTQLGATFYKFSLLVAEEMGLTIRDREAELLVAEHVGALVDDGLQEPVPIAAQTFRIFVQSSSTTNAPKRPWWRFW